MHDERSAEQRRLGVALVHQYKRSVSVAARRCGLDSSSLQRWLVLYARYGELIFAADAPARFEVELFQLKYPDGAPKRALWPLVEARYQRWRRLRWLLVIVPALSWAVGAALSLAIDALKFTRSFGFALLCGLLMWLAGLAAFGLAVIYDKARAQAQHAQYLSLKHHIGAARLGGGELSEAPLDVARGGLSCSADGSREPHD